MTDLEIAEQTLWCVLATRDDQYVNDPRPPSDELIQYWKDRVAELRSIDAADRSMKELAEGHGRVCASIRRATEALTRSGQ